MKEHFETFAHYNRWANARLLDVAAGLDAARLAENRGAFCGSVIGTVNHILVADRIWLRRITGSGEAPAALDEILYPELEVFRPAREMEDRRLVDTVSALAADEFGRRLRYRNMLGDEFEQPLTTVLAHLFNHQTHHRGQLHTLLTQFGVSVPPLDLIYFIRDRQG